MLGQTNTGSIHASALGQRWVAPSAWSMEIYSSFKSLHCVFNRGAEHILSQVLSLDTSSEPPYCV